LGKEAAVYLPSGTMCNEIAYRVHCRPGEEIVLDSTAHGIHAESGGPAAMAGVMLRGIDGPRGIFSGDQVRAAIRSGRRHEPRSRLLSVENTSNAGGGSVWPIERIREVTAVAKERGLACHMDGARLMNAVIASGTPIADYCAPFDSVWLDFSKGLGAPVGAVLAGSADFIEEAWRCKQQMGGAMRQAGIIAAACLYALDHHVERIAEDHDNAKLLAEGLAAIPGIELDPESIETNIVYFDLAPTAPSPAELARRLETHGVRSGAAGNRMRAVTHIVIDRAGIEVAIDAMRLVMS
jgi:threonine aldolase